MVVATNSTHTKVVHTNIVYVVGVVATNSTHVPHEVLAEGQAKKIVCFCLQSEAVIQGLSSPPGCSMQWLAVPYWHS